MSNRSNKSASKNNAANANPETTGNLETSNLETAASQEASSQETSSQEASSQVITVANLTGALSAVVPQKGQGKDVASDGVKKKLRELGIAFDESITLGEANRKINAVTNAYNPNAPITKGQREQLEKLGVPVTDGMTTHEASVQIGKAQPKPEQGESVKTGGKLVRDVNPTLAATLEAQGHDVSAMTYSEAAKLAASGTADAQRGDQPVTNGNFEHLEKLAKQNGIIRAFQREGMTNSIACQVISNIQRGVQMQF
jgi:hypothetical protein